MPIVQKLYDTCKASLSPEGPISEEALEKVRIILAELKPSNVGLEQEAQLVRGWKGSLNGTNGKKWRNGTCDSLLVNLFGVFLSELRCGNWIHKEEVFFFFLQMEIFCRSPGSVIPLHNHPGMTVLSKLLITCKVICWVYSGFDDPSQARPAKLMKDCLMSAPCNTTVLHPSKGGNIHCFKALTPSALFDILSPPYSSEDGRHCSYFRKSTRKDLPGVEHDQLSGVKPSEITWWYGISWESALHVCAENSSETYGSSEPEAVLA
ncbi:hypothetical protein JHK82_037044 [Glycine max]|nr:hypothetical protein JHK85_037799 [Glycine max]KAG5113775.1 hypothetical protein JHK82_037044 [Glycine max]KAG5131052.1 hypothetical protein JHK84_037449 [Glycine max]